MKQNTAARKYSAGHDQDHAPAAPAMLTTSGPEQREPDREGRVQRQREDAVGREQLPTRHDLRDHRRLGGREEHRHGRDEDVEQQDQQEVVAHEDQPDDGDAAQDVRRDEDEPPVDAVDVDAGDRREQHGRDEERQDQQADGRVGLGLRHDDRQPEQDHVAADLGRGLRQPEAEERRVPEDRERALGGRVQGGFAVRIGVAGR